MSSQVPTIYDWAGGRAAFERWLGRFYDLVEEEELLAPLFGGTVSDQHRGDVVTWWCEVMGGPAAYTESLGGYEHMLSKHRGLRITAEQRLRASRYSPVQQMMPFSRMIRSSGPRSWGTPSGAAAWRCTTPATPTTSCSMRPYLGGAGVWPRRTSRSGLTPGDSEPGTIRRFVSSPFHPGGR
jgi:hypothetical protein